MSVGTQGRRTGGRHWEVGGGKGGLLSSVGSGTHRSFALEEREHC